MSNLNLSDLVKELDKKKIEQGIMKSFKIGFSFQAKKEKSLIKLNGETICSTGNVSMIIAPPGSGKSNVCEAVASGAINPECDALGFAVDSENTLMIDTERVYGDVRRGLDRIKRRTGNEENHIENKLSVYSFLEVDDINICKSELEHIISVSNFQLVIIDGTADFVASINDEAESKSFWRWIIKLANRPGKEFGVLATIHPNPADPEGKAAGHLGSQGQKKAESVFNVVKSKDDKMLREITTELPHGKVRNAKDSLVSNFMWNEKEKMFTSCDFKKKARVKVKSIKDIFSIPDGKDFYSYKELCRLWIEQTGKSLSTAKRAIKEAVEMEEIVIKNGFYILNGMEDEIKEEKQEETKVGELEEEELPF
jgi:hypothetical protein